MWWGGEVRGGGLSSAIQPSVMCKLSVSLNKSFPSLVI